MGAETLTRHARGFSCVARQAGVLVGGILEVIVALAGIGTAVTLYPVVKRQNEGVALGLAAARVLEAGMIFTGVVSLLSLVTLRQHLGAAAGADAAALVTTGASHVAVYNWAFLLGQSLMPAINALLLGSLMYRSRLVPRIIPVLRLIGAPLLIAAVIATLFGGIGQYSSWAALAALLVAAWELSLGVWLVAKGFKLSPITTGMTAAGSAPHTTTSPPNPQDTAGPAKGAERLASWLPRRSPIATATAVSWSLRAGTPNGRQQLR